VKLHDEHRTVGFGFLLMMIVAGMVATLGVPSRAFAVLRTCGPDALTKHDERAVRLGPARRRSSGFTTAIEVKTSGWQFRSRRARGQLREGIRHDRHRFHSGC